MLSRPVEPQPVKKTFPPLLSAANSVSAICRARPDSANSRYFRTTSSSTSNSSFNPAAMSRFAVSLRWAVTGCEDSVVSAPSLNWSLIFKKSRARRRDDSLIIRLAWTTLVELARELEVWRNFRKKKLRAASVASLDAGSAAQSQARQARVPRASRLQFAAHKFHGARLPIAENSRRHLAGQLHQRFRLRAPDVLAPPERNVAAKLLFTAPRCVPRRRPLDRLL